MTLVRFVRYVISMNDIAMDLAKIEVVLEWKKPKNVREIHSFLGLVGYYRRFIRGFHGLHHQ